MRKKSKAFIEICVALGCFICTFESYAGQSNARYSFESAQVAAKSGDPKPFYFLAKAYLSGEGAAKDDHQAA